MPPTSQWAWLVQPFCPAKQLAGGCCSMRSSPLALRLKPRWAPNQRWALDLCIAAIYVLRVQRTFLACILLAGAGALANCGPDVVGPTPPESCVGVEPPKEAFGAKPGPLLPTTGAGGSSAGGSSTGGGGMGNGPVIGSAAPVYQLLDHQPLSCGHTAVYGLDNFKGHVTVAALFAGW